MAAIQAARTAAELGAPLEVTILEATSKVLNKVKISGGGRCNVLHDETKGIKTISEGYPRGKKQLLGALSRFGPEETAGWFRNEGVQLKTEADGRMFPVTDDSQTIVDALCRAADAAGVTVRTHMRVDGVERREEEEGGGFNVLCKKRGEGEETLSFDYLLLSPGSSRTAYKWAQSLGHQIQDPVPSLFTFNIDDPLLDGLAGVSVQDVALSLPLEDTASKKKSISERGPVLVTHTGLSGPALLRLSAFGARALFASRYAAPLLLNWLPALPRGFEGAVEELLAVKKFNGNKAAGGSTTPTFNLPRRLWKSLVIHSGIDPETRWAEVKTVELRKLAGNLVRCELQVKGKGVFKEEFVTAGGIALNGVDMKRMQSKAVQGLFFAGELLDVDGITGGYNLQSAWSTGTAAGRAVAELAAEPRAAEAQLESP